MLDGVTYPEQAIGPDTPLDGERALDLIVSRCQSAPALRGRLPEPERPSSTSCAAASAGRSWPS